MVAAEMRLRPVFGSPGQERSGLFSRARERVGRLGVRRTPFHDHQSPKVPAAASPALAWKAIVPISPEGACFPLTGEVVFQEISPSYHGSYSPRFFFDVGYRLSELQLAELVAELNRQLGAGLELRSGFTCKLYAGGQFDFHDRTGDSRPWIHVAVHDNLMNFFGTSLLAKVTFDFACLRKGSQASRAAVDAAIGRMQERTGQQYGLMLGSMTSFVIAESCASNQALLGKS